MQTIDADFRGAGRYWAISPDKQASIDLGFCDSCADLQAAIREMIDAGSGDESWDGWIVGR